MEDPRQVWRPKGGGGGGVRKVAQDGRSCHPADGDAFHRNAFERERRGHAERHGVGRKEDRGWRNHGEFGSGYDAKEKWVSSPSFPEKRERSKSPRFYGARKWETGETPERLDSDRTHFQKSSSLGERRMHADHPEFAIRREGKRNFNLSKNEIRVRNNHLGNNRQGFERDIDGELTSDERVQFNQGNRMNGTWRDDDSFYETNTKSRFNDGSSLTRSGSRTSYESYPGSDTNRRRNDFAQLDQNRDCWDEQPRTREYRDGGCGERVREEGRNEKKFQRYERSERKEEWREWKGERKWRQNWRVNQKAVERRDWINRRTEWKAVEGREGWNYNEKNQWRESERAGINDTGREDGEMRKRKWLNDAPEASFLVHDELNHDGESKGWGWIQQQSENISENSLERPYALRNSLSTGLEGESKPEAGALVKIEKETEKEEKRENLSKSEMEVAHGNGMRLCEKLKNIEDKNVIGRTNDEWNDNVENEVSTHVRNEVKNNSGKGTSEVTEGGSQIEMNAMLLAKDDSSLGKGAKEALKKKNEAKKGGDMKVELVRKNGTRHIENGEMTAKSVLDAEVNEVEGKMGIEDTHVKTGKELGENNEMNGMEGKSQQEFEKKIGKKSLEDAMGKGKEMKEQEMIPKFQWQQLVSTQLTLKIEKGMELDKITRKHEELAKLKKELIRIKTEKSERPSESAITNKKDIKKVELMSKIEDGVRCEDEDGDGKVRKKVKQIENVYKDDDKTMTFKRLIRNEAKKQNENSCGVNWWSIIDSNTTLKKKRKISISTLLSAANTEPAASCAENEGQLLNQRDRKNSASRIQSATDHQLQMNENQLINFSKTDESKEGIKGNQRKLSEPLVKRFIPNKLKSKCLPSNSLTHHKESITNGKTFKSIKRQDKMNDKTKFENECIKGDCDEKSKIIDKTKLNKISDFRTQTDLHNQQITTTCQENGYLNHHHRGALHSTHTQKHLKTKIPRKRPMEVEKKYNDADDSEKEEKENVKVDGEESEDEGEEYVIKNSKKRKTLISELLSTTMRKDQKRKSERVKGKTILESETKKPVEGEEHKKNVVLDEETINDLNEVKQTLENCLNFPDKEWARARFSMFHIKHLDVNHEILQSFGIIHCVVQLQKIESHLLSEDASLFLHHFAPNASH